MTLIYSIVTAHHITFLWQYMKLRHLHFSVTLRPLPFFRWEARRATEMIWTLQRRVKNSSLAENWTRIAQWSRLYSSLYPAIPGSNTYTVRYVNAIKLFLIFGDILAIFLYTILAVAGQMGAREFHNVHIASQTINIFQNSTTHNWIRFHYYRRPDIPLSNGEFKYVH